MGVDADFRRARPVDELSPAQVDMIQRARERASGRAHRRELATELGVATAFGLVAGRLALTLEPGLAHPWLCLWLGAICAAMVRIEFEVSEGITRPVQLAVVPMLLLLPLPVVPVLVAAAHIAARAPDVLRGRLPVTRLALVISDSWFTVAPALLLMATGLPRPDAAGLAILVAMLAAQFSSDFAISSLRLAAGVGIDPRSELRSFLWVYLVDVLLLPVGLLAAAAGSVHPIAVAAVLPLGVLLSLFARERRGRVEGALELQRLAQENEERLQSIVQNSSDLIVIVGPDGVVQTLTGSVEPVFGADWQEAQGTPFVTHVHPDDAALAAAFLARVAGRATGGTHEAEWRMRFADDAWHHVSAVAANLLGDARVAGVVLTVRDVEAQKTFEEQLRHRAFHDPLTSLANRALFYDRVEHALNREGRDDGHAAVLFVDLDDFKEVNDRLGHATGDRLLVEVAGRLRSCVRSADTAARLGGDEFGVLLELVGGPNEPMQAAERILAALADPMIVDDEPVPLTVSIGVAVSGNGDRGADELLGRADLAMYAAKRSGKRRAVLYDAELQQATTPQDAGGRPAWFMTSDEQRDQVLALLDRDDAIAIHCQPILDLRTGRVAGYEALSRFQGEFSRPPDVWFSQAHRCGLGHRLEAKAIAAALALPPRPAGTYLTLNVSPSGLVSREVRGVLPDRLDGLVVEITEDQLISDDPAIATEIAALRARGARLAVDDTGSGYAGLTHVMRLAPDLIKLDRAIVAGVHDDPVKAALIESFVRYARDIDATVCAEGIETLDDLVRLADLDVAYGQGWAIGRAEAPWAGAAPESTQACLTSFTATLSAHPEARRAGSGTHDGRLELLAEQLSRAAGPRDLDAIRATIASELGADAVGLHVLDGDELRSYTDAPLRTPARLCAGPPAAALARETLAQTLAGDATASREEIAEIVAGGHRSRLAVPIVRGGATVGVFEAHARHERPWSRFEIGRARIIAHQLGAAIEHSDGRRAGAGAPA
jgi:diguanylate cyclase (GGDEF)-like protein/PAS domain S-box-containing protein